MWLRHYRVWKRLGRYRVWLSIWRNSLRVMKMSAGHYGLVCKPHYVLVCKARRLYHSTLGLRVIKKQKRFGHYRVGLSTRKGWGITGCG